ncbi:MAG: glycoside hydrolase family 9 protein [Bacteroidales bacterium]|nr:glycoside hydrolase family 9 protein [Bacteroidales bacterium]
MKKYKLSILLIILSLNLKSQTPVFETEQYQKALWMTTRFYGAQRMGKTDVNWLVNDLTWENSDAPDWLKSKANSNGYPSDGKAFTKDADGSYNLNGGWFDCGDFVLFGQTFYYSAYMLLLGYSEFPQGYYDLYSANYNGYISTRKFDWESKKGKPNKIPDILDECKVAADFMMKSVRDAKTFYYEKGNGDKDHLHWCTSVMKTAMSVNDGGEYDGTRDFGKATANATSMASLAGASLAAMYRLYKDYDIVTAKKYLDKAKIAYQFATETEMGNSKSAFGNFYPAKEKYLPDLTILCAELYRATGDKTYLNKCNEYTAKWISDYKHNYVLNYNNTEDIALYAYCAMGEDNTYYSQAKSALKNIVESYPSNNDVLTFTQSDWGVLRYVANEAFAWALYSKLSGETTVNKKVLKTVEYILGNNSQKFSYVVGVNGNGTNKFPFHPHHRNFYRSDVGSAATASSNITESYKYLQLGMLVGGSCNNGEYNDDVDNHQMAEGGIDYNAGLVGALGYVVSKIAPVESEQATKTVTKISVKQMPTKTTYGIGESLDLSGGIITVKYSDGSTEDVKMTNSMASGFKTTQGGTVSVKISYSGKSATFVINVIVEETGISLGTAPKTDYVKGESLDITGGTIHLNYNDGTFKEIEMTSSMISGFSSSEPGIVDATINYKGYSTPISFMILKMAITKLELYLVPTKKQYYQGESLDITGGQLYVVYENNTEDKIDLTPEMVKNFDSSVPGLYTLSIQLNGHEVNYDIEIIERQTAVEEISTNKEDLKSRIYSYDNIIVLKQIDGLVEVFNMMGQRIFSGRDQQEIRISKPGIYIVRTHGISKKVFIK